MSDTPSEGTDPTEETLGLDPSSPDGEAPDGEPADGEPGRSRRWMIIAGAVLAAMLIAGGITFALLSGSEEEPAPTTSSTTTTTLVTTTTEPPSGPVAPLTGLRIPEEDGVLLLRPALAVKIDNDPKAVPQWGLAGADLVFELRVEGISRFLAVYHSQDVGEIGPVRSARTSDPDLLAAFGRPLTAWSGANPATNSMMRSLDWIQNVSQDRLRDAYRRERSRKAPHNLVLDAPAAFRAAVEPVVVPTPVFEYLADGEAVPGEAVPGVEVRIGFSRGEFVWSEERAGWLRWSDGTALTGEYPGGSEPVQVAATNVVVLETAYGTSSADPRSPEAISVGEGRAWVFTAGRGVEGRWQRTDRTSPWTLTTVEGLPLKLTPGPTWIEMPSQGAEPTTLSAEVAQRRLES